GWKVEQRWRKSGARPEPDSVCAEGIDPNDHMNDGIRRVIGAHVGREHVIKQSPVCDLVVSISNKHKDGERGVGGR
ncbi:unnamed protein product, partial [Tetraodon nigroviridis]